MKNVEDTVVNLIKNVEDTVVNLAHKVLKYPFALCKQVPFTEKRQKKHISF